MLSFRPLRWTLALVCGLFVIAGCTASTDSPQGESGSLALDLIIADDVEINEVTWTITGGDMPPMSDTIDTSAPGATASVEVFGLPPGDGYNVELEATDETGEVTCKGSADFSVEVGVATDVMVMLNCKLPQTLGGVRVNGKFNVCPQLAKAVVSPLQTSIGNDITLSSIAEDVEGDPITYVWSGTGGTIADPNAPDTTFTCGEAGNQTVTILVSDDGGEYCMDMWTVPVTCVEGDTDLCEGVTCDDTGNECTEAACNPANGQCEESNVDDGTECDGGEGMCMNGVCEAADLCQGVTCDDTGNDCTEANCNPENGECEVSNVDDGTSCENDTGMCMGGQCVITDLCEGVTCDDTGNECTVGVCNNQTGECDEMNVEDGTSCNDGAGVCSAGQCVDNDLCEGVDCTSAEECVEDGTCDPANGECIPGDPSPADAPCGDGGVCDGAGTCVDCNDATQCPDDTNECTAAACEGNQCGQTNVMDGTTCDFGGADGVCEGGTCVEAPDCTVDADCDDMNVCTTGACVGGACEFDPADGGACEVEPGVPGTCGGGNCVGLCEGVDCTEAADCVQDGTCDVQSGNCIAGDNEPEGTACDDDGGSVCDGAGACVECNGDADCTGANEVCVDNACVAQVENCGTTSGVVQIACSNGVTDAQSPFPNELSVTVNESVSSGAAFTAEMEGVGVFPKFFLDAAQTTVPGGVRAAIVEGFNATVAAENGSGSVLLQVDPSQVTPGLTQFCQYPSSTVCTDNSDCIVPPCNEPVLLINVPTSPDCSADGVCADLGQGPDDGAGSQCNITSAPSFCVISDLDVPLFAPGGPEVLTAGASGDVVFNWIVDPVTTICGAGSDSTRCTANGGELPNGALILPPSIYGDPVGDPDSVGLNGIRLNVAGALFVALQCSGGQDGGSCSVTTTTGCLTDADCPASEMCVGVGVDDDIILSTDLDGVPTRCPIN